MLTRCFVTAVLSLTAVLWGTGVSHAQDYPSKPIRIYTSPAGGGGDFVSRAIAQGISGPLGQQVVVDNRGGAVAGELVAKAAPDGYSLLINGGTFYILSLLRPTPYDPLRDFSSITITSSSPNVLAVHPSLPVRSVKDLIALAKARPGELNYASAGLGTIAHLFGELFKSMTNVSLVHIAYKGSAQTITALIGGEVQLTFSDGGTVDPHIKSGRLRGLAVTSARPSTLFPGLPTVESTVPGYEATSLTGVFAPARTPGPIITRLNQEIVRVLKTEEVKDRFFKSGAEAIGSSSDELTAWMKTDMERWGKVIKDANIKAD